MAAGRQSTRRHALFSRPGQAAKQHRQRGAQGEQWDRESGDSKGRPNALTVKPTGATKTPGPFSAVREFGILGHGACGSTCNTRILPEKAPEKDRGDGTGYCLCSLHSAPASMPKDRLPRARCPRGGQRCGKGGSTGSRILRRPVPAEGKTDFFELPVRRPAPEWTIPPRQDFSRRGGSDMARSMAFCAHPVYKEKTL